MKCRADPAMYPRRWAELQAAFDALVELSIVEREHRLTALDEADPELRTAIESLLRADSEAETRLAKLEGAFASAFCPDLDPLGLAGRTVAHFNVAEPIGVGGMGIVYRADDTRLGRAVALKFLLPPYSLDASAKARFLREARAAATLDHPNLCVIHDVGATDDGRLYLAMALYTGETLKARLARESGMALRDVLGIAAQLAAGLKAAHAGGIVHRDLKPGNVMLLPNGTVKILDFGLAKATDQSLTESAARFGTISYMAPEQIRDAVVDRRSDLWAFGVVLYEMLTGRKPFGGERGIAIAHTILHDKPVPPSMYRDDLPVALENLVLRLLQKTPARRCSDANEVLSALAFAEANPEEGCHPWRRHVRRASRAWAGLRQLTFWSAVRS